MQIELSSVSQAKMEDLLEELYTRYDLADVTPGQLLDALLDIGVDLLLTEEPSLCFGKSRLLEYCARSVTNR